MDSPSDPEAIAMTDDNSNASTRSKRASDSEPDDLPGNVRFVVRQAV